jgi:hypothetical protein
MTATHPFTEIESRLRSPPADGVMFTHVVTGSPLAEAGVAAGDVVVRVGEIEHPDRMAFLRSFQPRPDGPPSVVLSVLGADGATQDVDAPIPLAGVGVCGVRAGVPAWTEEDDSPDAPDLSAFETDGALWLRNSLEETRAGFEILVWRREGDLLHLDIHFTLGGDDGQGGTWEYVTTSRSTHRLERGLPVVRTAFWEMGNLRADVALGDDGVWRGERGRPDGTTEPVERADVAPMITAYTCTLLPLTMPLREGARLTVASANDGAPVPSTRFRFECIGRETVKVDGEDVEAWCIVQRHYGLDSYGGDERMYVTDDRRLARVDWGPNYAGCWGELVAPEDVLDGVPDNVHLPDQLSDRV